MEMEKITELADKIQAVNMGGIEASDLVLLSKTIGEADAAGKIPLLTVFPTDVFAELFDDGDFSDNVTRFSEIQNRHIKSIFEEYAAWKILQLNSKKIKK